MIHSFETHILFKIMQSSAPVLVAFSGGKDSVAMVLYLLEMGVPKERIHLHHHLVDGAGENLFDWPCTESYCQAFADQLGLQLFFSYRKGGILREILRRDEPKQDVYYQVVPGGPYLVAPSNKAISNTRLKFPAISGNMITRWCSAVAKIDVLRTSIAHNPAYLGEIFVLTGERRQESPGRAKYQEVEPHKINCHKRPATAWRPIIDWTEEQVWQIMARWKVQPHPAYMLGWNRCSCQLCIFGSPAIWASIAKIQPAKVDRIADIEHEIDFTMYVGGSIRERVAQGDAFTMDPFWIGQATGIFTAPVIIDKWKLPAGAFRNESAGSI
jgi:3'-phosphoadenosine 5'-phosphosulfate sulfotransferase (PAPS reductase)/FAD synthetase